MRWDMRTRVARRFDRLCRNAVERITGEVEALPEIADPGAGLPFTPLPADRRTPQPYGKPAVPAELRIPRMPTLAEREAQAAPDASPAPVILPRELVARLASPYKRKPW